MSRPAPHTCARLATEGPSSKRCGSPDDTTKPLCSNVRGSDNCFEYLGPAYDPSAMAYRLKFMRNSRVTFVDIDARTGRVLSQR